MLFRRDIEVKYEADVFIAGGGPSGVAAAVFCARMGKKVYLAEQSGAFGGAGTVGMVPELMNMDDGVNFLAGGIGKEIIDNLYGEITLNRDVFVVNTEEIKRLYDEMMIAAGVEFSFFTKLVEIEKNADDNVEFAILSSPEGLFAVRANVFIDCSGSGELCAMAGADFMLGDENGDTMPATLCSLWADIDFDKIHSRDDSRLSEAIEDGVISINDKLLPGIKHMQGSVGGGNIGHCFKLKPLSNESLTNAMTDARKRLMEYDEYYRKYLTGYEKMYLCATANMLGIRESRRIVCDEMLLRKHYFECAVFENEIGRHSYLIDIHSESADDEGYEKFLENINSAHKTGESYGIPYGSLVPKKLRNVLVAGKCIGSDRSMQASVRTIPGCYVTGQAAGVAAALACDYNGDVRAFEVSELQANLKRMGAFLPNFKQ